MQTNTTPIMLTYAVGVIDTCVKQYLSLVDSSLSPQMIGRICAPFGKQTVEHIREAWVSKEREFGSFYLNLDGRLQRAFLESFGIEVEPEKMTSYEEAIRARLQGVDYYDIYPREILLVKRFLLMANNNSLQLIDDLQEAAILQSHLDSTFDKYGTGTNWGRYYLSLMDNHVQERCAIVEHAIHYT